MLSNFISAAAPRAPLENGTELAEVIEGWLFLKLRDGDHISVIDGHLIP